MEDQEDRLEKIKKASELLFEKYDAMVNLMGDSDVPTETAKELAQKFFKAWYYALRISRMLYLEKVYRETILKEALAQAYKNMRDLGETNYNKIKAQAEAQPECIEAQTNLGTVLAIIKSHEQAAEWMNSGHIFYKKLIEV